MSADNKVPRERIVIVDASVFLNAVKAARCVDDISRIECIWVPIDIQSHGCDRQLERVTVQRTSSEGISFWEIVFLSDWGWYLNSDDEETRQRMAAIDRILGIGKTLTSGENPYVLYGALAKEDDLKMGELGTQTGQTVCLEYNLLRE